MGRSCMNVIRINSLLWAEKMVKYGLYNMQDYLTLKYNNNSMSFFLVAGILNVMKGISLILEVFLLFLVDEALLGYKTMILISSIALGLGMGVITMSTFTDVPVPVIKGMASVARKGAVLYTGMVLVSIGRAGYHVFIPLLLEQQKDNEPENNTSETDCAQKIVPKLRQLVSVTFRSIIPRLAAVALTVFTSEFYLNFGIPTMAVVVATLVFLSGWQSYNSSCPDTRSRGSPLINFCRVLVASARKRMEPSSKLDHRDNLYVGDGEEDAPVFTDTRCFGCLHKAAIKQETDSCVEGPDKNKWKLCSVAEVEEAKVICRMILMSTSFLIWGIVSSVGETYFMEQVTQAGEIVLLCYTIAEVSFCNLSEWVLKKAEKKKVEAAPSIGIAVAMVLSVLCCAASAVVESWRRQDAKSRGHGSKKNDKMCTYWFVFQFSLLGSMDGIFEKSIAAFYRQEAPESINKYLDRFTNGAAGMGFMYSVLSVYAVKTISEKVHDKHDGWFKHELDESHLDKYYWVLAGLSLLSLAVFVVVAACYKYKKPVGKES